MSDQKTTPPLVLGSAEGGTLKFAGIEGGRFALTVTTLTPANVNVNNMDRAAVVAIRDYMNGWLANV